PVPVVEKVTMSLTTGTANFVLSQNGTLVYVPGGAGGGVTRSLAWVNRQGHEEPIKALPRAYTVARLSPDGTRVALEIRDQDNDGTIERLTTRPNAQLPTSMSPDGTRVLFTENTPKTGADIGILTLPSPAAPPTATPPTAQGPLIQTTFAEFNAEVSPDGRWV